MTFDGTSTNFSMGRQLGARFIPSDMSPSFKHPTSGEDVYIVLDACHMIKLLRNCLGEKKILIDIYGQVR